MYLLNICWISENLEKGIDITMTKIVGKRIFWSEVTCDLRSSWHILFHWGLYQGNDLLLSRYLYNHMSLLAGPEYHSI